MRISDWSSDVCSSDLLLDEPFSNLDTETRQRLAGELRGLLRASGATVLMVTHDQGEAFAMADHVGVMDGGRILQWDTPAGLYARPAHRYVAGFVGRGALVPARSDEHTSELQSLMRLSYAVF